MPGDVIITPHPTSAEDCLRHIKGSITGDDFKMAVIYIELLVSLRCYDEVSASLCHEPP